MATTRRHDVKDLALAADGLSRIEWADRQMPVLAAIRERFQREQPLAGYRVSACLHVTSETANLMRTLKDGGADVVLCASNPLSTQDDVAASLVEDFEIAGLRDQGRGQRHLLRAHRGRPRPQAAADDGRRRRRRRRPALARREQLGDIIGGTEETTTGVIRLRALERGRRTAVPRDRRERRQHQALLRQSLRHGPDDDRRDFARDEHAACRAQVRRRRLRLVRPRGRRAREGAWERT